MGFLDKLFGKKKREQELQAQEELRKIEAEKAEAEAKAKAEEAERISEKMLKFKGLYDKKYDETVKCFFFENATNIIPVDEYTVLESER